MRRWLLLLAVVAGCQEGPSRTPTCDQVVPWPAAPVDCRVAGGVFQRQSIGGTDQPACIFSDASDSELP